MKKTLSQIITLIGTVLAVVGIVVDAITRGVPTVAFSLADLSAIAAVVAIAFIFGKNQNMVYLGYLISLILGLSALSQMMVPKSYFGVVSLGFTVMAIASIVYFFVQFIKMLGFEKADKE